MIRTALRGLRGRLLLAFVATSAVTLAVAAAITLSPLQQQLRDEATSQLQDSTETMRTDFKDALTTGPAKGAEDPRASKRGRRYRKLVELGYDLSERTNGRVSVTDDLYESSTGESPAFLFDTGSTATQARPLADAMRARREGLSATEIRDDELTFAMPVFEDEKVIGVVVAQRDLTEVARTVTSVRNAFFTAAAIGLAVAILLAITLSGTLTRRLGRLQRSALRITAEGPEAPAPLDRGRDEVGDLARAIGRMQEELRRQEAARRSFVSTASHELRTPLTILQGTMELLDEDLRDGGDLTDAQEQVASARRELRRLSVLASELLDLSRLDAAVLLRSEPVELGEIARAVKAEFELLASERGVAIEVDSPGPCWATGDPAACARVVRILIDNALRYAPPGEPIEVATTRANGSAIVRVHDRGPGVPPEERERIFERFHRGKATSEVSGFGLGLAIGRELAERMSGTLDIEPSSRGAKFAFTLPASGSSQSSRTPSPAPGSAAAA